MKIKIQKFKSTNPVKPRASNLLVNTIATMRVEIDKQKSKNRRSEKRTSQYLADDLVSQIASNTSSPSKRGSPTRAGKLSATDMNETFHLRRKQTKYLCGFADFEDEVCQVIKENNAIVK